MCTGSWIKKLAPPRKMFHIPCSPLYFFLRAQISLFPKSTGLLPNNNFIVLMLLAVLLTPAECWAWEVKTHEELTEEAIEVMNSDLNTYLVENLGLIGGLEESLPGGTPIELMKQGSNFEDNGVRFLNHFHEPVENKGSEILGGISAINWSLSSVGEQEWSWNDARDYYFKALTSETKKERNKYWSKTFRALGQVMHLLQDSANPSHVRDDIHPSLIGIGDVDGLHDFMARQRVASYLGGGIFSPDTSMLEQVGPVGPNKEPFANLFDRNTYLGGNPGSTLGTNIGVTEYTNANFFSDDTIPGQNSTNLVYPNLPELIPATTVPFGPQYLTLPRLGASTELKARVAKFTGNQSFVKFRLTGLQLNLLNQLQLDDLVYEAYAINLIPRAVGYSAAVLDYFFRLQFPLDGDSGFTVIGTPLPHPEIGCELPLTEDEGTLFFDAIIPVGLNFNGTASLYYEKSDGSLVLVEQLNISPGDPVLSLGGVRILAADVPDPVRSYVVLEGMVGPGTQEHRAILADTHEVAWEFGCFG